MEKLTVIKTETEFKPGSYPAGVIGKLVDKPTMVFSESGELLAAYFEAPRDIYNLGHEISNNTKPAKSSRTRVGVPQLSTVYGPLPRIPIREDYCRFSRQTKAEQVNMEKAMRLNELLSRFYKENLPDNFAAAKKHIDAEILPDYRLVDTPWTNININMNQVIKYHRDAGNNREDLSNVLIVKKDVDGGHLACPEYGFTLHQGDGFMVFFKGQEILHGVTPCTFKNKGAYRASIVNYTLNQLKHCYPYEKELERLQVVKSRQAINKKQSLLKLSRYLERAKAKKETIPKP